MPKAKKKLRKVAKKSLQSILLVSGLLLLVVGLAVGLTLTGQSQFLGSFAANPRGKVCVVPKGNYQTSVVGSGAMSWKLVCGGKTTRQGTLLLNKSLSLGSIALPQPIRKGQTFQKATTLAQLCSLPIKNGKTGPPDQAIIQERTICDVCKFVDCNKLKLAVSLTATDVLCSADTAAAYTVSGQGKATASGSGTYKGMNCTVSGTATGTMTATLKLGDVIILEDASPDQAQ